MAATRTGSDFLMFSSSLPGPSAKRSAHVRILRAPAMRSRRASPGQRIMLRTADRCAEFPSPHGFACAEDHIGYQKTITFLDRELRRSLHASGQLPTSALGQKQTSRHLQPMSALPPKSGHWLPESAALDLNVHPGLLHLLMNL